ncbi:MAG: hypothetical protein PXY39_13355 [archaeon]|nr:hypothetical protein [archaeon]
MNDPIHLRAPRTAIYSNCSYDVLKAAQAAIRSSCLLVSLLCTLSPNSAFVGSFTPPSVFTRAPIPTSSEILLEQFPESMTYPNSKANQISAIKIWFQYLSYLTDESGNYVYPNMIRITDYEWNQRIDVQTPFKITKDDAPLNNELFVPMLEQWDI